MHVHSPPMPTYTCIYVPQARSLQAVPRLVKLFNHANQEVQRHATGAMRNLIYDNVDNKLALVEENGIFELLRTLREQDDELRKNVTGTLVPPPLHSGLLLCPVLSLPLSHHTPPLLLPCPQQSPSYAFPTPSCIFRGLLFKSLAATVVISLIITWWVCTHSTSVRVEVGGQFSPSTVGSGD